MLYLGPSSYSTLFHYVFTNYSDGEEEEEEGEEEEEEDDE